MTRKRLWSLTAAACIVMAFPSLLRLNITAIHVPSIDLSWLQGIARGPRLPTLDVSSLDPRLAVALAGTATVTLLLMLTVIVIRRRRTAADLATVLARRGRPVAAIARETRLSQDAIRDLLGGEPMVVSTASRGKFFRRRPKTSAPAAGSFADEMSEKAWEAKV